MKITEKNFIKELKRRNEDALEFVIRNYGGLLKSVINRVLYDYREDAEECLYDTIMKIWKNIDMYDNRSFEAWSAAIAKHTALDRLRKVKKLEPAENIDEISVADMPVMTGNALFDEVFAELISCLNETDKALFTSVFWNGYSVKETAKLFNMPKSAVYNHISRGKRKIIQNNPDYFAGRNKHE